MAEETLKTTITHAASKLGGAQGEGWQDGILQTVQSWHGNAVMTAEKWLDHAASIDLSSTNAAAATTTWSDEWKTFQTFFDAWADRSQYWQIMTTAFSDAWIAIQSMAYWIWITTSPFLYSISYIVGRLLQSLLGALLPKIQSGIIEICRFHLYLTWREAVGEVIVLAFLIGSYKFLRYLQKQQYVQRTRKYLKQKSRQVTKVSALIYLYYCMYW